MSLKPYGVKSMSGQRRDESRVSCEQDRYALVCAAECARLFGAWLSQTGLGLDRLGPPRDTDAGPNPGGFPEAD